MKASIVVCALAAGVLAGPARAQAAKSRLSGAGAKKLGTLLASALAQPSGKALKQLIAEGRKLEKKHSFTSLIDALRKGPRVPLGKPKPRKLRGKKRKKKKEPFERFGSALTGFGFEVDGHRYQYAVDLPPGFDNKDPVALLVDPGHGKGAKMDQKGKAGYLGFFRGAARRAGGKDWLVVRTEIIEQIGGDGLRGQQPEDEVCVVFDQLFRDLASRFRIDVDRIYVGGLSQTGFWAWYLGRARADRMAGIVPMGSRTWHVDAYLDNFQNLPVHVLHGDGDMTCPVADPRRTCAAMKERGMPVEYQEIAGAGHDTRVWQHLGGALKKLAGKQRVRYPKKIAKRLQTTLTPWCYWIRINGLKRKGNGKAFGKPTAWVEASVDGQTITIRSEGIKGMTVCLASELVDLEQKVEIRHNKKRVFHKVPKRDFSRTLRVAVDKGDWLAIYEAFVDVK